MIKYVMSKLPLFLPFCYLIASGACKVTTLVGKLGISGFADGIGTNGISVNPA